jgi:hypothetical protein
MGDVTCFELPLDDNRLYKLDHVQVWRGDSRDGD